MRAYKIFHLSLAFMALVALVAGLLMVYIWQRQAAIELSLETHERQSAQEEIHEALSSLEAQTRRIGQELSDWDETRQQLAHTGYYAVWRDARVRDSGRLPDSIDGVALYDKEGRILQSDPSPDPMPETIAPVSEARFLFKTQSGHDHILYINPVHADPAGKVLLGFLGVKADLILALQALRKFRYVDVDTMSVNAPAGVLAKVDALATSIKYDFRPNPSLDLLRKEFHRALWQLLILIGVVVVGAAYLLHRTVVRPLHSFAREIDEIQHTDSVLPLHGRHDNLPILELENVRHAFQNHHARLTVLHGELEEIAREFQHQAVHDALTGVYNRRAFDLDGQELVRNQRGHQRAMLLFDCDRFKEINDNYGHDVGDAVLKGITDCLQRALRIDDKLYRLGGDEFAALLKEADRDSALAVASRCRQLIGAYDFASHGVQKQVNLSIGIALDETGGTDLETLQKQADTAMYAAKRSSNDKIVVFGDLPAPA